MDFGKILLSAAVAASSMSLMAEEKPDSIISQSLNASGVITVIQPAELERRLVEEPQPEAGEDGESAEKSQDERQGQEATAARKTGGYRVQVFSDNNPRTAKNEARAKAKEVGQAFPSYRAYVVFTAPYWRLRVGDFRTHEEAENAATQIKRRFPNYSREVRVVRDRVNATH